jgi:threonine aldolase
MRQAGVIAAAALYALDHHLERLVNDHANAQRIAAAIREVPCLKLVPADIDTNIVIFEVDPIWGTAAAFCDSLKSQGVLMSAISKQRVRGVTHLDVSGDDVTQVISILTVEALCT